MSHPLSSPSSVRRGAAALLATAGLAASALGSGALTTTASAAPEGASPGGDATWAACAAGAPSRQAAFARAARASGVPEQVLLGVSYLESRWDDHGAQPSTSGGYGPLHLTAVDLDALKGDADPMGKGEAGRAPAAGGLPVTGEKVDLGPMRTLDRAAALTGLPAQRLKTDDVANICGGAALLARYQHEAGGAADLGDWAAAVARYSGAEDQATAWQFTRRVFASIRAGEARTTNDRERVRLAPQRVTPDRGRVARLGLRGHEGRGPDCTAALSCESVPAPYEQYGSTAGAYGNHDLADRPQAGSPDVNYIVIHDTEATWDTTLGLVQDPTYVSWHYSVRSSDGHIAQHVPVDDVAWHAGNWYVNMHSIGIEHEGFAPQGATWFTEDMYRTSAKLVRHLASKYDVPLDRAHIIGHDQVPGILPAYVKGMHWDPGPYWDWEHYFDLLRAPIGGHGQGHGRDVRVGDTVVVKPGFKGNEQPVTGCDTAGEACESQGTNFVYLRTAPSADAPLVTDLGIRADGSPSTTEVADIGARAAAGQELRVAGRSGDWLKVWYLGDEAWLQSPRQHPTVQRVTGRTQVVSAAGDQAVPVYGRAYPEESAYPETIPYQAVAPLQYTIEPGQSYVVADSTIQSDYYYAKTFQCAGSDTVTDDCTQVPGQDRYYEVWFGHRMAFVRAADVDLRTATPGHH